MDNKMMKNDRMKMNNPMMQEDGAALEEPAEDTQADAPYKICLAPHPDGTFHVYKQSMAEEPGNESAAPSEEMHDTFTTMEEALKQVIRIFKDNPVSGDEHAQMMAGARAEGYGEEQS